MTGAVSEVILATAGYDHTIRFWEALSGICLRTIQFPDSQVNKIVISPDKRFIVAAGNPQIRLYDVHSGSANSITAFEGHTGNVTAVGFQSAGRWLCTGSEDGRLQMIKSRDGENMGYKNTRDTKRLSIKCKFTKFSLLESS